MKRTNFLNILLALVMVFGSLLTAVQPVSAAVSVINPGFETGDLTGWTASDTDWVYIMGGIPDGEDWIAPKERDNCADLISTGPSATTLSQNISAAAGDTLSGWLYFVPGPDGTASATLSDTNTNVTLFTSSDHSSEWVEWSYTLTSDFNGELTFSTSGGDYSNWNVLGIDDISSQSLSTASAGGPYSVNEGSSVTMHGSYANATGQVTYTWSWEINGTPVTRSGQNVVFSAAALNGTQDIVINLSVSDAISTATTSTVVHVLNVAPIISFTPQGNDHITLGQYYFNSGIIVDPGYGNVSIVVNYDDTEYVPQPNDPASHDNIYQFPPILPSTSFTLMHKFSHQGLFNVLVSVTDSSGATDSKIIQVKVDVDNNTAPYITQPATTSYSAAVGETLTIKFASYDIDADAITITPNGMPSGGVFTTNGQINGYGTFTWNTTGAIPKTYPMIFAFADGVLTANANITLTVTASGTDVVIVVNNPPHAEAAGPYSSVFNRTSTVTLDASASSDLDAGDVLTYQWDIDYNGIFDISAETVTLDYETLSEYGLAAGPHPILLKVTDQGGLYSTDYTTLRLIAPPTFTISPSTGPHGSINPSTEVAIEQGNSQEFTITPDTGYYVADVLVDSISVGAVTTYTFSDINAAHTISASFLKNKFDVSVRSSANPSTYGQPLTFTSVISPSSSETSVPDGAIQFKANGLNLGSPVNLAAAEVNGQRSAALDVSDPLNAGSYSIVAVFSLAGDSSQTATLSQQINKVTPVITWANPSAIYYGAPLSSTQLNASTTIDGTFIYDPALGNTLGAGEGQPLNVSFVPSDTVNYNSSTALVNINVLKAAPDFSSLSSPSITVGTANIILGGNISLIPVGNVITITVNGISQRVTVLDDGSFSANFDTSLLTVGVYEITYSFAGDDNYTAISDTRSLSVNAKIDPVITWATPDDIVYGTALSETQLNANADVSGTFIYDTAAGTLLDVGSHILKVDFAPGDSANYNTASNQVGLNVLQASPEFSDLSSLMITEGAAVATLGGKLSIVPANSSVQISLNGFSKTTATDAYGNFSVSFDTSALTAIDGPYTVNYSFAGTSNCLAASGEGSITVNAKINPVITWNNPADIVYGSALSAAQLNATTVVVGTSTYTPAIGTVLDVGQGQTLSVSFVPDDATNYNIASLQVYINVLQANTAFSNLSSPTIDPGTTVTTLGGNVVGIPAGENITISLNGITQTALVQADGTFSTDFDTSALVAGSSYSITYSYAGTLNYSAAAGTGDLAVSNSTIIMYSLTINCDCNCDDCDSDHDGDCDGDHDGNCGNNQNNNNNNNQNNGSNNNGNNNNNNNNNNNQGNNGNNNNGGNCDGDQDDDCDCSDACKGTVTAVPAADQEGKYAAGTVVTLTATANSGYAFTGWSGDLTGNTNPAAITMNSDKMVTATFAKAEPGVQATNFVIWGGNQAKLTDAVKVGQQFTFWSSQWDKQVKKGSYAKNAAFKGWANQVSADGKNWTTAPGNSCNPPESISEYISVIVTTSITKKGSTISGNSVATVILKVDNPGSYQPNPGHSVTGTVVSITLK